MMLRRHARKTGLAGLFALALLCGTYITVVSSAHADGAAAVFYGYVVPEPGGVLPKRIRALSDSGVVCGSAEVWPTASSTAGFYAMSVISADAKPGCPAVDEPVHFALLYGMIDETIVVGGPAPYLPGTTTALNLIRTAADRPLALP